jgi:hypothetical protein
LHLILKARLKRIESNQKLNFKELQFMPSYKQSFPSSFLKVDDIPPGGAVYTIASAENEEVGRDDNKEIKLCLHFVETEQKLTLNRTNADTLGLMFGEFTEGWINQQILIYVDPNVRFGGKIMPGLRISDPAAPVPQLRAPAPVHRTPQVSAAPQAAANTPQAAAPQQTALPAPPQAGQPMVTAMQKTLLVREAQRVWGEADYRAKAREQLGNIAELTGQNAEEWITWLKSQPDFKAAGANDDWDDSDPFSDD